MDSRKLLIYLATKYQGDWDSIYNAVKSGESVSEEAVEKCYKKMKSKAVTILDEGSYPESLRPVTKPPFVLFYHGDINLIKDKRKAVSIVGSRLHSYYGEKVTKYFSAKLSKDVVIISGMARGIDSIAHEACIRAHGKTVAVLGCGINICFPSSSLEIYDIMRKDHLIISEYPDLTPPQPKYFPIRNRIIAGLSDCLLITEGKVNSGTAITARLTLESGGNVCCIPGPIRQNSLSNHLIMYGARLVETPSDVLDEMNFKKESPIF